MEGLSPILVQLIAGAIGGTAAGGVFKKQSLGILGNSIAGLIGGGVGGQLLELLGIPVAAEGSIVASFASGGIGGGLLMIIAGVIKNVAGIKKTTKSRMKKNRKHDKKKNPRA